MAYTTIDNGEEHFNTVLYTGDGSADNDITGVGFAPDFVWAKNRGAADAHWVLDSTRGATKGLYTNGTAAENTQNHLISFDSDGFSVGNQANGLNTSSNNYVAWNWKANGGTTSSNSNGSITSTVQANTTAGFSIVTYTGTGSNATVGHGLGAVPAWVLIKNRDSSSAGWYSNHQGLSSGGKVIFLNVTNAETTDSSVFNSTDPTSTVFSVGTNTGTNGSSNDLIAYCFAEKQGYSKFGSFAGNNNSDGAFVYLGFKPAWIMIKSSATGGSNYDWVIFDNKRNTFNVSDNTLDANLSNAEVTSGRNEVDFLSNGFKCRESYADVNSNTTYIYIAFAEHPFVSSKGVPTTAR